MLIMPVSKSVNELLKVLDMPKDSPEQYGWLLSTIREHKACCPADLAFRLRDELVRLTPYSDRYAWNNVLEKVYQHVKKNREEGTDKAGWGLDWSQPIHWIIAALIAKENK